MELLPGQVDPVEIAKAYRLTLDAKEQELAQEKAKVAALEKALTDKSCAQALSGRNLMIAAAITVLITLAVQIPALWELIK